MPVHVLCLIDALAPPGTMVGRTAALIRQRLQRYGCQLIVLESFKQFPAATRCSPFSLPVETLTAPRIRGQTAPGKRMLLMAIPHNSRRWLKHRCHGCEALRMMRYYPYKFYRPKFFSARSISRLALRSAAVARLSYSFLPLQRPSSIFTRPHLKYSESGTSV